jgi:hypothetical protein
MANKVKSLASAAALGSALLFLGPSTSTARADQFRHGRFDGRVSVHRSFAPVRHRGFVRPFRAFAPRVAFAPRPYRLVRVFVAVPFPHWAYRRVYYSAYPGAYCPY